jgi:hypothetical protein
MKSHKVKKTKPTKRRKFPSLPKVVKVPIDYLARLRRAAGLQIDPETAEVHWTYARTLDPYGDYASIPKELDQVGREYFARVPNTDVWIVFSDLPSATAKGLLKKHASKLAFPAGLEDVFQTPSSKSTKKSAAKASCGTEQKGA